MAGTRMFYSGVEGNDHYNIAKKYAKRVLTSYFYVRKNPNIVRQRYEADGLCWMIDSGAFTLQIEKGSAMTTEEWEAYVEEYAEWLWNNRKYIYAGVEVDVGNQVGIPIVNTWKRQYFEPLERAGMQIIYVWHEEQNTASDWVELCRNHRYMGVGGDTLQLHNTQQRLLTAKKFRTRIHGFALTSGKALRDFNMATADSTSWKAGERYGVWGAFDGDHIRTIEKKNRPKWEAHIRKAGFDYNLMCREDRNEVTSFCISEYVKMEETFASRKTGLSYWEMRSPYPEVVLSLPKEHVDEWVNFLNIAVEDLDNRQVLYAVSLLQNSCLDIYLRKKDVYDATLAAVMDIVVRITDMPSMEGVLSAFNARYKAKEEAMKRKEGDYASSVPITERPENWEAELAESQDSDNETEIKTEGGRDEKENESKSEQGGQESDQRDREDAVDLDAEHNR